MGKEKRKVHQYVKDQTLSKEEYIKAFRDIAGTLLTGVVEVCDMMLSSKSNNKKKK